MGPWDGMERWNCSDGVTDRVEVGFEYAPPYVWETQRRGKGGHLKFPEWKRG